MTTHIKLIKKEAEYCVVLTKKLCGIPVPGKTYYFLTNKGLETRKGPIWMPFSEANITFSELRNEQSNLKDMKRKGITEKRGKVEREVKI